MLTAYFPLLLHFLHYAFSENMFGNGSGRFPARELSFTNNFSNFEQQDLALLLLRVWSKLFMLQASLRSSNMVKWGNNLSDRPCIRVYTDRTTGSITF